MYTVPGTGGYGVPWRRSAAPDRATTETSSWAFPVAMSTASGTSAAPANAHALPAVRLVTATSAAHA
ncbi:hypothetical protein [Actinoallomurus sp. NPDC050550]|uniref:hypothetical protein n=1 Tax=Actinoallomurus sp. NPDC050550 TaxID=3154937 RepID=UPI0033F00658